MELLSRALLTNILITAFLLLPFGLSFYVTYRVNHFFDLTPTVSAIVGAYVAYGLSRTPLGAAAAILCSVSFAVVIRLTIQRLLYESATFARLKATENFLVTFCLAVSAQAVGALIAGDGTLMFPWKPVLPLSPGAWGVTSVQTLSAGFGITALLALCLAERHSRVGLEFRATAADIEMARIMGIPIRRVRVFAAVAEAVLAAVGGILLAWDSGASPEMSFRWVFLGIVATITGGGRSLTGCAMGCLLVGALQHLTGYWLGSLWQDAAIYLVFLAVLLFRAPIVDGRLSLGIRSSH